MNKRFKKGDLVELKFPENSDYHGVIESTFRERKLIIYVVKINDTLSIETTVENLELIVPGRVSEV